MKTMPTNDEPDVNREDEQPEPSLEDLTEVQLGKVRGGCTDADVGVINNEERSRGSC